MDTPEAGEVSDLKTPPDLLLPPEFGIRDSEFLISVVAADRTAYHGTATTAFAPGGKAA